MPRHETEAQEHALACACRDYRQSPEVRDFYVYRSYTDVVQQTGAYNSHNVTLLPLIYGMMEVAARGKGCPFGSEMLLRSRQFLLCKPPDGKATITQATFGAFEWVPGRGEARAGVAAAPGARQLPRAHLPQHAAS